jgi:hypothetical protein
MIRISLMRSYSRALLRMRQRPGGADGRSLGRGAGHGSVTTALRHYAHAYEAAKLAPRAVMVDAIGAARAAATQAELRPGYVPAPPRRLRQAAPRPWKSRVSRHFGEWSVPGSNR